MDALAFLNKAAKSKRHPVYLLTGDEDFLKRRVVERLQTVVLEDADPAFALAAYAGDKAEFTAVRNELDTLPFLAPRRMVLIEQADAFVTKYRPVLEKYVQTPSTTGVLVLVVRSEKATTKLAKSLPDDAFLACSTPAAHRLPEWCVEWAKARYGKRLVKAAAELLVELIGPNMGQLDQELDKLAVFVGEKATVDAADVDVLVGRSREGEIWKIFESVGEGNATAALTLLAEKLDGGDDPLAILGALGSQVRRLAKVWRLIQQNVPMDEAFDRAGVAAWPKAREGVKKQMQHLGRRRLDQLYDWLLEVDQGMKGGSPLPARLLLERLIVRLARPRAG